jgi:3-dehydroquinate synthase
VLAQNDSGVGVKTSINAFGKKNFIGTFAPPHAVINDWSFLTTLEDRDWCAGAAEAVKVGLIRDGAFCHWVHEHAAQIVQRDMPMMQRLIHRCAELHCKHIATCGDPFEMGAARPLDFGHWAAHKLEQMTNFDLRHGEAVAIGIALDVAYSGLIGSIDRSAVAQVHECLQQLHLPISHPAMKESATLMQGLEEFREHLGGRLTITLLRGIGAGYEVNEIDRAAMKKAIDQLVAA